MLPTMIPSSHCAAVFQQCNNGTGSSIIAEKWDRHTDKDGSLRHILFILEHVQHLISQDPVSWN
jgi:hypothetical protein